MLHLSDGIENLEAVSWELVLALLGTWTLICLPVVKGIKSAGKVQLMKMFVKRDHDRIL